MSTITGNDESDSVYRESEVNIDSLDDDQFMRLLGLGMAVFWNGSSDEKQSVGNVMAIADIMFRYIKTGQKH